MPNQTDENSAVTTYFQLGMVGPAECARLRLLAQVLKEPTFTQLRVRPRARAMGLRFGRGGSGSVRVAADGAGFSLFVT